MAWAVLERAILDFVNPQAFCKVDYTWESPILNYNRVRVWMEVGLSNKETHLYSYPGLCSIFNIDAKLLFEKLCEIRERQLKGEKFGTFRMPPKDMIYFLLSHNRLSPCRKQENKIPLS